MARASNFLLGAVYVGGVDMQEELFIEGGKVRLGKSGVAFATRIRKTRGSLFHTLPREICLGCDLKKGQELVNYIVRYGEGKMGLFIPLNDSTDIRIKDD
jgi:hypothetical protein